ncbi:MAG: hypothetical protein AAF720_04025 [Pseudomonadota bacterium]
MSSQVAHASGIDPKKDSGAAVDLKGTAGSVALGDAKDGVADQAFVLAPPNYAFVVAKETGSFLDCGDDAEIRTTDDFGRDAAPLACSVTLTETIVIPAASESARLTIHY